MALIRLRRPEDFEFIDSPRGRRLCVRRMATVDLVFANIRHHLG